MDVAWVFLGSLVRYEEMSTHHRQGTDNRSNLWFYQNGESVRLLGSPGAWVIRTGDKNFTPGTGLTDTSISTWFWILGIWTQVFVLAEWAPHWLGHLPSPKINTLIKNFPTYVHQGDQLGFCFFTIIVSLFSFTMGAILASQDESGSPLLFLYYVYFDNHWC